MIALLIFGSKTKKRVLPVAVDGSSESEFWPAFPIWYIFFIVISQAIMQSIFRGIEGLDLHWKVVVVIGYFSIFFFIARMLWLWWLRARLAICKVDDELTNRANEIAARMGKTVKDVRIDNTLDGQKHANARIFIARKHIIIARKDLEVLIPDEIDWILAHEIAHIGNRRSPVVVLGFALLLILIMCYLIDDSIIGRIGGVGIFVLIILEGYLDLRLSRNRELKADSDALEATRNLQAAESALKHLIEASRNPKLALKDTTHPSLSKRIDSLRETAMRIGLPAPEIDV